MKKNSVEKLAEEIDKKYQKKDSQKKRKMKVSGTGVKKIQKIIKEKNNK